MNSVSNDGDAKSTGQTIPYSLPGIICYLQHEWTKMEAERQLWALQRAEYETKISMLNGEVMGLQNLKTVLIRRIKMLEYALKQERFKGLSCQPSDIGEQQGLERVKEPDVQLFTPLPSSYTIKRGKQLMKKFLEEIGHMDNLIDLRSERARLAIVEKYRRQYLLSNQVVQSSDQSNPYRAQECKTANESQDFTSEALEQFEFLNNGEFGKDENSTNWPNKCDFNENATMPPSKQECEEMSSTRVNITQTNRLSSVQNGDDEARYVDEQIFLMSQADTSVTSDNKNSIKQTVRDLEELSTLHGHMDVVRCVVIHKFAPLLITGSDDHTAKLWDISNVTDKRSHSTEYSELFETIRSHTDCVSAVSIGPKHNWFFTADITGKMFLWSIVSLNPEDWHEQEHLIDKLAEIDGHKDAIACLETISSMDILLASFADCSLQMWFVDKCDAGNVVPANLIDTKAMGTAVRFIPTLDDHDAVVGFNKGSIVLWDLVKQEIVPLVSAESEGSQLTDIACSLEQPNEFVVASYCDGYLRWFDLKTGKFLRSMMAHQCVITSVNMIGSNLVTAGNDGMIRLWTINKFSEEFVYQQEQTAHRRKADEGVVAVCCRIPLLASAGADSLCRLFLIPNISDVMAYMKGETDHCEIRVL